MRKGSLGIQDFRGGGKGEVQCMRFHQEVMVDEVVGRKNTYIGK